MKKQFLLSLLLISSAFLLAACGKTSTTSPSVKPAVAPKLVDLPENQRPYVSLIPRADGHNLTLKINKIPTDVVSIGYELVYNAVDSGNTIQKGADGTIKDITSNSSSRDILLGTASCTNGCKYKYDDGVIGGTISLSFFFNNNQESDYSSNFTLNSAADIKKAGGLTLTQDDSTTTTIKTSPTGNDYFVFLKNYPNIYTVFTSGNNTNKYASLPANLSKTDNTLAGDYQIK